MDHQHIESDAELKLEDEPSAKSCPALGSDPEIPGMVMGPNTTDCSIPDMEGSTCPSSADSSDSSTSEPRIPHDASNCPSPTEDPEDCLNNIGTPTSIHKTQDSGCSSDENCIKYVEENTNFHGRLRYSKGNLTTISRQSLGVLRDKTMKTVQAVSEQLVQLLQERHTLREQVEMRRVAIGQLLTFQNETRTRDTASVQMSVVMSADC